MDWREHPAFGGEASPWCRESEVCLWFASLVKERTVRGDPSRIRALDLLREWSTAIGAGGHSEWMAAHRGELEAVLREAGVATNGDQVFHGAELVEAVRSEFSGKLH